MPHFVTYNISFYSDKLIKLPWKLNLFWMNKMWSAMIDSNPIEQKIFNIIFIYSRSSNWRTLEKADMLQIADRVLSPDFNKSFLNTFQKVDTSN